MKVFCTACAMLLMGCAKFIEVAPPKSETIVGATVYTNDAGAIGALIGIYGKMINSKGFAGGYNQSVTYLAALSADELTSYSGISTYKQFYENAISANNAAIETALWNEVYQYIYSANAIKEGVENPQITAETRRQVQGEVLFIRALCHFYLVNLYGDVPLVTSTSYLVNMNATRTPRETVYQQIMEDLKTAQEWLGNDYVAGLPERIRPNKAAATALLSRVYLYRQDWANAEAAAGIVINDPRYELDELDNVFLKISREAIWRLKPNEPSHNTWEGNNFILNTAPTMSDVNSATLSPYLLEAFESGDKRMQQWVDSVMVDTAAYYFPYKYKIKLGNELTEYSMVLRLAEQYLIRAEARAHLGNLGGARADLNMIRRRAGLPDSYANTRPALLAAIAHERQVELFTEWGHRWLDLKRTNKAHTVLGPLKGQGWQATDTLYPLPQNEMLKNTRMQPQNPGY
jgi:hypothetical protein